MNINTDEVWVPGIAARLVNCGIRFSIDLLYDEQGMATGRVTIQCDCTLEYFDIAIKRRLHSGDYRAFELPVHWEGGGR